MASVVNLTATTDFPVYRLGQRYVDPETGKIYRYVQVHASGTALIPGYWAYRYATATKWVVSATPASAIACHTDCTGLCNTAIAVGYYGWLQTRGEATLAFTNNAGAGAATINAVGIPCSTAGAAKFILPSTNTEYTVHAAIKIALAHISETSATTTYSLARITVMDLIIE